MPEIGNYESPYKLGEAKALIAPLLGCAAEEIDHFIIIARDSTMSKIGVFHTMFCSQPLHAHLKAIDLVGEYLQDVASRAYADSPQHGPEEG